MSETKNVAEIFGMDSFNDAVMRERLPKRIYDDLKKTIREGSELKPSTAEVVANAMKDWAIEHGATHYTHWFQPMTGVTAEKHDAFVSAPTPDGRTILEFSGKELVKGEPDASSFPSGGIRSTFEARGYTAWDCTSPAFLKHGSVGTILCIPTAFCSYTGEALDKKTPLLRSMQALNEQALRVLRLMGNTTSRKVMPCVGAEQEYFLISRENYLKRKDLIYTGRTLFGAMPSKGQEMEDHYFGSIPESVGGFMRDLNDRLWRLGIPAKTQHNEVAPAQHELAPIYAQCNVATDQNQLIMECMKKIACSHGLTCLLNEKPFAGVNGSGKHNNWSLSTDDGINLLNPGKKPHENQLFLMTLSCIIKAVDLHADLLRWSAADVGNDHRLGLQEAPPAIISIFLGEQMEDIVDQLIITGEATHTKKGDVLHTGVSTLPEFAKDATDRNRTSPFAFTGNKFEFRMVGSSDSIADCNVVINTIVAEAFCEAADRMEAAEDPIAEAQMIIAENLREHRRIIFNGDGYAEEWVKEAARRGLLNIPGMVDAIPALTTPESVEMFERLGVMSLSELAARQEIAYEIYAKTINIEAHTMLNMAGKKYIPAVIRYLGMLGQSMTQVMTACPDADVSAQRELILECSDLLSDAKNAMAYLEVTAQKAAEEEDIETSARLFRDEVVPAMEELREPIDRLEFLVDKTYWPYPSYGDMMFQVGQ
ncbi:MAG: glutamine synthetase III [Lachnospiraceae bacterium]|nr:glutamine synthetase III [Lachnospiraceae bacterium]